MQWECRLKGNNCIKRILWSLAQLYTLVYVLRAAFLLLWPVTTTTYCAPVYRRFAVFLCVPPRNRRFAVFLCVPPQNRRFAGFNEWLMNADDEAKQWLSWTFIPISCFDMYALLQVMHFECVWMLYVLYTLLLSHTNPQVNKYITIAIQSSLHQPW